MDLDIITQPNGHPIQVQLKKDMLPLGTKVQSQRCSQRANLKSACVNLVQDESEWSVNLSGMANSSGVECSGVPICSLCSDAGTGLFNTIFLGFLTHTQRDNIFLALLPQQLTKVQADKADEAEGIYSQVTGPPVLKPLFRQLGRSKIAHIFFRRST